MKGGMKKAVAMGLSVLMTLGLTPASAFAVTGSEAAADATYTKSAEVVTDSAEDWQTYTLSVSVAVQDGLIQSITADNVPAENASYVNRALNRTNAGINAVLSGQPATVDTVQAWDTVSAATIASRAIKNAVIEALTEAPAAATPSPEPTATPVPTATPTPAPTATPTPADDSTYVLMNIPYDVFYSLAGTKADTVSGATAKVRNSGVAGLTYNGGGDATNTTDVTDTAKGVQVPVKVADPSVLEKYTQVTDETTYNIAYSGRGRTTETTVSGKDALIQAGDYAYYKLTETPAYYLTLNADSSISSISRSATTTKVEGSADDITYGSHWGTYQVEFPDGVSGKVAAVTITVDGTSYGLKTTDNIWRSMEIAWNAEGDLAATKGGKLEKVTVYTESGIYEISYDVDLKDVSDAEITAAMKDSEGTVSGLPADIENPKVTVSYTEGTGRSAVTTKYIENAELKDGKFEIPDDTLAAGTEYTVTVSSDNYLDLTASAVYAGPAYVVLNVPYEDFYKLVSTDADAVSKATSKVRIANRAGASYNGGGNAENTTDVTDVSKGGQFAVKVADYTLLADEKYTKVTDETSYNVSYISHGQAVSETLTGQAAMIQAPDYAYYTLASKPAAVYLELTADGLKLADDAKATSVAGAAADVETDSYWGDYQVNFPSGVSGNVAAVTITVDGKSYGLKALANIWRSSEIAWSASGDLAATSGGKLEKVTVYTDEGIYEVSYDVTLKEKSDAAVEAELSEETSGKVTGLPSDIKNPKATVSYTVGSGHAAVTTTVVADADVNDDGTFAISADVVLESGKTYDVTVSSDNYLNFETEAAYTGPVYVLMNIPYDVFYKVVGTTADTVSGATVKVRNAGVAGAVYNGSGTATRVTDVTDKAKGVQYAVKIADPSSLGGTEVTDATSYNVVYSGRGTSTFTTVSGKNAMIQADDYAYYVLSEKPEDYLTYEDGAFKASAAEVTKITGSADDITYGSHWGTYLVEFPDGVSGSVRGVTVTVNGKSYGLTTTDHIWRSMEIAWDAEGDLAATNGGKLEKVTVYTTNGIYEISYDADLKAQGSEITAALKDTEGTVAGLPEDIKNPKATVSYTAGTGRNAVTTTYVTDAEVKDGKFAIPADTLSGGTEYTVTVSSDNYIDLSAKAAYDGPVYVILNVPYDDFYKVVSTDADAVSKATSKVRIADRAGASYNGGENATNTTDVTDVSRGGQFVVRVADTSLLTGTEITDKTSYSVSYISHGQQVDETLNGKSAMIQAPDYAYYKLAAATTDYYLTLSADGLALTDAKPAQVTGTASDVKYATRWGNYQVDFPDGVEGNAAAVTITVDGKTYGLKALANIWKSSEIAWNASGDLAATNGGKLEKVTVYTDEGIYEISYDVELKDVAGSGISAALDIAAGTVSGLPEDIQNPKATISLVSGRKSTTVAADLTVNADGTFAIPDDAALENGTTYTVKVTSDNYVDLSATAVYSGAQDMFRLYNPNSGEHFFTANAEERDNLVSLGWKYEGIAWTAPVKSNTPVYRLYNKNGGEHHYTTSIAERDGLVAVGWTAEGIGWYSDDARRVPVYRVYNPNAFANNHHYTKDKSEKDHLVSIGWKDESYGWYAVK